MWVVQKAFSKVANAKLTNGFGIVITHGETFDHVLLLILL